MSWKFWKRIPETPEERIKRLKAQERPEVYVTHNGARYVKADELLYSKQGRAAVKRMAEFARRQGIPSGKPPETGP